MDLVLGYCSSIPFSSSTDPAHLGAVSCPSFPWLERQFAQLVITISTPIFSTVSECIFYSQDVLTASGLYSGRDDSLVMRVSSGGMWRSSLFSELGVT